MLRCVSTSIMRMLSARQKRELKALAAQPGSRIDLTDIPEVTDWNRAIVAKFYRSIGAVQSRRARRQS